MSLLQPAMLSQHHRRYNALTGEWVLVSPHRTQRPWQGRVERVPEQRRPAYDPGCYLCPGNSRAGGAQNPAYSKTFVFTNDFSAMLPEVEPISQLDHPLLCFESEPGECRVVCFSPRHDLTLAEMELPDIQRVIHTWAEQTGDLGEKYQWVQVFENKGEIMGCSNPHPHGQIWASNSLPEIPAKEDARQREYFQQHGRPLLVDYAELELGEGKRVVALNDEWQAVVPFWAVWPFEVLLLPRRHVLRLTDLSASQVERLAEIMQSLLRCYDRLFEVSFPYSMGWHGTPGRPGDQAHWQLHAHYFPPLLRSATVKKFMVGYEMLAEPQRDITPEQAAETMRKLI